jgi:hypothetical protein
MASSFAWLDYSEHDRRTMLDVINCFTDQDTRDELGIGAVRDAFADLLFPGTSTIQTRARYFLFVPWIYLNLESLKVPANQMGARARQEEIRLIAPLLASEDSAGTFGSTAREKLKRLPSSVYWQGLSTWGIRLYPGAQSQYHRSMDSFYTGRSRSQKTDDAEWLDGRLARNWHAGLPKAPKDFPNGVSLRLQRHEAIYLQERLLTKCPGTLLALLVGAPWEATDTEFPWEHPHLADFPAPLRELLDHAQAFSESVHGAALLYNLMLAETAHDETRTAEYQHRLQAWDNLRTSRQGALARWERARFWELARSGNPRIAAPTYLFINIWLDLALSRDLDDMLAASSPARQLIHDRERFLKRGLARLDNARALEQWSGAAGAGRLGFRWANAQLILSDILTSLQEDTHA